MPDLTYLAKGLNMIGQSYLANKSAQRQFMNQVALEKMKQDSWLRNLQEQNRRYEITQQRILEQHQADQQRQALVESSKAYRDVELAKIKETEEKNRFGELIRHNKAMEKIGFIQASKKPTPKTPPKDTTLDDLLKLRKTYEGKTQGGIKIGENKAMLYEIDKKIRQLSSEKYGFSPLEMEKGYYLQGLTGGGFTEEDARRLTEQRFAPRNLKPSSSGDVLGLGL